jgi:carboxymethylenebutenolidase
MRDISSIGYARERGMCHDPDALPPPSPAATYPASGQRVVLSTPDGNRFASFAAVTGRDDAPGVVVLPDVRGLHPFYEELALRFAEAGVHGLAIDYYGRTAGIAPREDDFDGEEHFALLQEETVYVDAAAALRFLGSKQGLKANRLFTVGFCFGGRMSFNQAAFSRELAGVIGFYGRVVEVSPGDMSAPINLVGRFGCKVLGLFGGTDPKIGPADAAAFRHALQAAGVDHEIVVYDDAPHSFFDRSFVDHKGACQDAWQRMLLFITGE